MKPARKPRIAVSGPPGAGKTTLARAIGESYGVPVLEEGFTPVREAPMQLERLVREGSAGNEIMEARKTWLSTFVQWLNDRNAAHADKPGFVADCWEADLLDLWLIAFAHDRNVDPLTTQMMKQLYRRGQSLDLVILLPLAKPLVEETNSPGLSPTPSFTNRLLHGMITTGIIHTVPNLRVLKIPAEKQSLADRMSLVDQAVRSVLQ